MTLQNSVKLIKAHFKDSAVIKLSDKWKDMPKMIGHWKLSLPPAFWWVLNSSDISLPSWFSSVCRCFCLTVWRLFVALPGCQDREFWRRHHLGLCNHCYHPWKVETEWTSASCHEPSLPGQTGYQQAAFWDGAGKAQTVWCARLGARSPTQAQFPHLPSLTHLLTVWTVSSRRRHYIFFSLLCFLTSFCGFPYFSFKATCVVSKQPLFLQCFMGS